MKFSPQKICKIFNLNEQNLVNEKKLLQAKDELKIPNYAKNSNGKQLQSWSSQQLPEIGKVFGFTPKLHQSTVITVFVTKGGVLKTSLSLNIARLAAINNIKTCVVGLDMQGDVTSALGFDSGLKENVSLHSAMEKLSSIKGLPDLTEPNTNLLSLIVPTDLPTLSFIPETPELVRLERSLSQKNKREYWLQNFVINPLKEHFDLIILDASPNWNLLITNALTACDVLISPLECKINNYRNFKMFDTFIKEFKSDMSLNFEHVYVPTRWQKQRNLSIEILDWYKDNLSNCSEFSIPEQISGEESSALNLSVSEHSPGTPLAIEYSNLLNEILNLANTHFSKLKILNNKIRTGMVTRGLEA